MSDAQSINVDDFRTAANEMRKAYGHHNAVCASTDLLWRALAEIESDAKVIAEKDAEIGRLNSAFDDCAENANASQAEVERLEKVIAALKEALSGIVEYCSGDGRPLGAIDRLVAVRNTAERALAAANEQTAGESK